MPGHRRTLLMLLAGASAGCSYDLGPRPDQGHPQLGDGLSDRRVLPGETGEPPALDGTREGRPLDAKMDLKPNVPFDRSPSEGPPPDGPSATQPCGSDSCWDPVASKCVPGWDHTACGASGGDCTNCVALGKKCSSAKVCF